MHESLSADNNPIGWTKVLVFLKSVDATQSEWPILRAGESSWLPLSL